MEDIIKRLEKLELQMDTMINYIKCDICGKYLNKKSIKYHKQKHQEKKEIVRVNCEFCGTNVNINNLKIHHNTIRCTITRESQAKGLVDLSL